MEAVAGLVFELDLGSDFPVSSIKLYSFAFST
jgi:hypothetical protein